MLRWGILGDTGPASAVAPAMRAGGADLAVVATGSLSRAQAFAAQQGVRRARQSYDDVLTAADVDAVFVALSPDERETWAVAALEAGKHVLCAVPMGVDAGAAGRMAAASAAAGRVLMEALVVRFHPRTDALLDLVRGGGIGEVRLISTAVAFATDEAASALARPAISVVRWLLGDEPATVRGRALNASFASVLSFASGAQATVAASRYAASMELLQIASSEAVVRVPAPFTATRAVDATIERDGQAVGSWRADPYGRMLAAFDDAIVGGPTLLPPEDAVATAAVVDAVRDDSGRQP